MPRSKHQILASIVLIVTLIFISPHLHASNYDELIEKKQEELVKIQKQISRYEGEIKEKKKEVKSLRREIAIFRAEINRAILEIRQTNLAIEETTFEILTREEEIGRIERDVAKYKEILGEYIRLINEYDEETLFELILKQDKFSDFFNEINSLENIQLEIQTTLDEIRVLRQQLLEEQEDLEKRKSKQEQLRVLQIIQKRSLEVKKREKDQLLEKTRGKEILFEKLRKEAFRSLDEIRNELFVLKGMEGTLTLEKALEYAQFASSKTGIRPAFLLAVLKKESQWGANPGKGSWRTDMRPSQHKAFLEITKKLGLNPDAVFVSKKPKTYKGWGGAMGPAQFMPTTWLVYEKEIAQLTGHNPPSPWDTGDAFMGAAVKLTHSGANTRQYEDEWKAAMKYFAGGNWDNPAFSFYGNSVMALADTIQEQIDLISE